jgi:hypothetical protein
MRVPAVLVLMLLAGCAAPALTGPNVTVDERSTHAPPGSLPLLHLNHDGTSTWLATASTHDVPVPLATSAGVLTYSFPLEPPLEQDVATGCFAVARVPVSGVVLVNGNGLRVTLLVGDERIDGVPGREGYVFTVPAQIEAGRRIELQVCSCGPTGSAFAGYLQTGSATLAFAPPSEASAASVPANVLERGPVTVRREGERWVAERVDSVEVGVLEPGADVRLETVNGGVEASPAASRPRLQAFLQARGDTETQALERLDSLHVAYELDATRLAAQARTAGSTQDAWQHVVVRLDLESPDIPFGAVAAQTTNGGIQVRSLRAQSLRADTTNGEVDMGGTYSEVVAETTNGGITATVAVDSGRVHLETTNGQVRLALQRGDSPVDARGSTTNGDVTLSFAGAQPVGEQERESKHVRSPGYDSAARRVDVVLETTNGSVVGRDATER